MKKTWDAEKEGPAIWVDGGDFSVFDSDPETETTRLIVRSMADLQYSAVNLGHQELESSYGPFDQVIAPAKLPYCSANVRFLDTGERLYPPWRIVEVPQPGIGSPLRIGFIGIAGPKDDLVGSGPAGRSLIITSPAKELADILPELRKKADVVAVISSGDRAIIDRALQDHPDLDLFLLAISHENWKEPKTVGRTRVMISGDRGRVVQRVAIRRGTDRGLGFEFETIHLGEKTVPEDPEVAAAVGEAISRFNEQSRTLMKAHAAAHPAPAIAPFVGAMKCGECHAREYGIWAASKHAHALETLARVKRDYTKSCVFCHVTGYGSSEGGGFVDPALTPQLIDVQCEACHGPGEAHAKDPSKPYGEMETPGGCQGCHDPDNSAAFDYTTYWAQIAH